MQKPPNGEWCGFSRTIMLIYVSYDLYSCIWKEKKTASFLNLSTMSSFGALPARLKEMRHINLYNSLVRDPAFETCDTITVY